MEMSKRQKEVYNFISQYHKDNGICPAMSDIADGLALGNSTIVAHVRALKIKGLVTSIYRVPRSLKVVSVPAV
jgi:SOS-response transcriptional repressor LexA